MTSLSASLANYYWNDTLLRKEWFQTLQEEPIQLVLPSVWMSSYRLFAQANPRGLWFSECGSKAAQTQRWPVHPLFSSEPRQQGAAHSSALWKLLLWPRWLLCGGKKECPWEGKAMQTEHWSPSCFPIRKTWRINEDRGWRCWLVQDSGRAGYRNECVCALFTSPSSSLPFSYSLPLYFSSK